MRRLLNAWEMLLGLGIAVAMLGGSSFAGDAGLPLRLEGETLDMRFRLRPPHPHPAPIVIVAIDDASITEIGRWPWSRRNLGPPPRPDRGGRPQRWSASICCSPSRSARRSTIGGTGGNGAAAAKPRSATRRRFDDILSGLARRSDPDTVSREAIERAGNGDLAVHPGSRPRRGDATARSAAGGAREAPRTTGCAAPVPTICRRPRRRISGRTALAKPALLAQVTTVPDGAGGYR